MGQAVQLLNDSTSPLSPAPVLLESAALCAALRRCVHHMLACGKGAAAALERMVPPNFYIFSMARSSKLVQTWQRHK